MIHARVHKGRLKLLDPIPESWEGCDVTILPPSPDEPIPDLDEKLARILALGPAQFEPGEEEQMWRELNEVDRISREQVQRLFEHNE